MNKQKQHTPTSAQDRAAFWHAWRLCWAGEQVARYPQTDTRAWVDWLEGRASVRPVPYEFVGEEEVQYG